jgi:hypothetical protein
MMFPVSTLFLAALVFNAASTFGAPLRIPDTSSVTARSEDSPIAARTPVVAKRPVQIVSDRGTTRLTHPITPPEAEVKVREEPQLVRRYPRKVYYDLYEKREPEPEPATTVKESTVMITKLTTFDTPADAAAHAKALDTVTSTVFSSSQTTTLAAPEVSGTLSTTTTGTDTVATPTPTTTSTGTPAATPEVLPTGSVTPTPSVPTVIPTTTPTGTDTTSPAPAATGTPTPSGTTPTPSPVTGAPSTPSGTPDHLAASNPPATPSSPDGNPKPSGLVQREMTDTTVSQGLPGTLAGTLSDGGVPSVASDAPEHPSLLDGIPVMLSGRQLASSGATLASAMRRSDHSPSSK